MGSQQHLAGPELSLIGQHVWPEIPDFDPFQEEFPKTFVLEVPYHEGKRNLLRYGLQAMVVGSITIRSPGAFERSEKAVRWSVLLSFSLIHYQLIP